MSQPSRDVPKFSSFRAKTLPVQEQPSIPTTLKRQRSSESPHHSVKRHKTPRVSNSPPHDHGPSRIKSATSEPHSRNGHHQRRHSCVPSATKQPLLVRHDKDSDLFIFDGKGDRQNVAYQSLHKYSIPPYQRVGYGNILGLDLRFKIDRAESTIDKVFIIDKSAASKQVPQRLLLKRSKNQELPALLAHDKNELDLAQDFVVFSPSTDIDADPVSSPNDPGSFRDLVYPESHAPQVQKSSDLVPTADLQARQRNIQLIRATKINPSDLQAWLDLASHQEHLVSPAVDASSMINSERKTLADLRIAVYEKALKQFPENEAPLREELLLRLLSEASITLEAQKYKQKLQDTLQQHLTSFPIWTLYLNACQANPVEFRFEDVKAFFIRSLRTLGSNNNANHNLEAQHMILYLTLRYTFFLRDTGYVELSIATWQALCEYHLFRPEHLAHLGRDFILADFEKFWESERPRFGEEGARGWCIHDQDDGIDPELRSILPDGKLASSLPFKSFSTLENTMNELLRFPGRTMDQPGNEDPFHVVFFSDLQEVLAATTSALSRDGFLDALFCYLGLPEMNDTTITQRLPASRRRWRNDVFLDHGLLHSDLAISDHSNLDENLMPCYQTSTDLLFSRAFQGLSRSSTPSDGSSHDQQTKPDVARFAQRILSSLVQLYPSDDGLAEYYLAFQLSCFPSEASRVAKKILKQRPSSLRLYNACATIEAKLGKTDKAIQIWTGAIKMKASFSAAAQQEFVLLWRGLIWCDLETNNAETAVSHLASFGCGDASIDSESTSMSTATLLRLRKAFKDGFEHASSQSQPHLAALNAEMLALVAYLTESDGLCASINTIQTQYHASTQRSSENHILLELLHQIKASILSYHVRQKRAYRPAFLRCELEASIKLFPTNNIFLEMYRDNEVRFRLDDRVRSILKTQVLTNSQSPLVGWTFAISQELLRYTNQSSGATAESVRSTFNRALLAAGSPVRFSQLLWMKWFQFEKQAALKEAVVTSTFAKRKNAVEQQPLRKLKQVFLSGLHTLPWSKDWVLIGLDTFDRNDKLSWEERDLRRLYNVLAERELRIRVEGLEAILVENE